MDLDEPQVRHLLERAMVARIASLSQRGRPSVNPLYFICRSGQIWLGTADWTLAARNVRADARVSLLFAVEQDPPGGPVLRMRGRAVVRVDSAALRAYNPAVVRKYILTPAGLRSWLSHLRQVWLRRSYTAQSAQKGRACVIAVTPEEIEIL